MTYINNTNSENESTGDYEDLPIKDSKLNDKRRKLTKHNKQFGADKPSTTSSLPHQCPNSSYVQEHEPSRNSHENHDIAVVQQPSAERPKVATTTAPLLQSEQDQPIYPYSIKIEQTAKGARVSVHCYNMVLDLAVKESIEAYVKTRKQLQEVDCVLASEE